MTEYSDKSDEAMASAFIVSTCQILTKQHTPTSDNTHESHDVIGSNERTPKRYSIMCGSKAEFYIRPLNRCTMDVDYLVPKVDEMAFTGDIPVLPSDISGLSDTIECYSIESSNSCPGFVRLKVLGEMNFNWRQKKYEFKKTNLTKLDPGIYMTLNLATLANKLLVRSTLPCVICGPAIKSQHESEETDECDFVSCLFCPQWPREAQTWCIRPRKYGWPSHDTITEVVQHGCHVVYVQHRSCRQDIYQWRLSFSVAEVILLQSWTQIQQIVYHLLRFFSNEELIQKDCSKEDEVLCQYHLKTLMLWTCEEMPPEWWNSSSVIAICCELLQKLLKWLKRKYCPNYFIPKTNLFHQPPNSTVFHKTERRLNEFRNSGVLSQWFVENYIQPGIHVQFQRYNKGMVSLSFMDNLLPLLELWETVQSVSLKIFFSCGYIDAYDEFRHAIKSGCSSGLRQILKYAAYAGNVICAPRELEALQQLEKTLCLKYYINLLYSLHSAFSICCGELSWDSDLFVELVITMSMSPNIVRSEYHNFPKTYTAQSCRFQFQRAQNLMQNLTGSNSRSEFRLLSLMSKECLIITLVCGHSNSSGIAIAAFAYLAALNFATSAYQQGISCCLAIGVGLDKAFQKNKEALNAGCLLFLDDIARIVGLWVLHKKITEVNLHYIGKRLYLDLRLSPEVFAQYIAELIAKKISQHFVFKLDFHDSFPMDEYLKALGKPKRRFIDTMKSCDHLKPCPFWQIRFSSEMHIRVTAPLIIKGAIIDALMEYSSENMTMFYSLLSRDFGIQCNTGVCYRALHLYKCRQYDEALHLCQRILSESDLTKDLKEFSLANILLLPPIDSFFDRDIQSLLGFHTLFYYLSPQNDELLKSKGTPTENSTFEHWFASIVYFNKFELPEFLRGSFEYHYFLGRHFLARYLKVRCCIDSNLPHSEALTEFVSQKTNLPFEHIIRRYLLQKLRLIRK